MTVIRREEIHPQFRNQSHIQRWVFSAHLANRMAVVALSARMLSPALFLDSPCLQHRRLELRCFVYRLGKMAIPSMYLSTG